jgi:hypothetical protein
MSAPEPLTVNTPEEWLADPAAPTEPISALSQGLGKAPLPAGVVALAWFDGADDPAPLTAVIRKKYVVDAARPPLVKAVPVIPLAIWLAPDGVNPLVVLRKTL